MWFQPTLPLRGATSRGRRCGRCRSVSTHAPLAGSDAAHVVDRALQPVSTHAPLAGSDSKGGLVTSFSNGFNPRSPCGERQVPATRANWRSCFNPRSPCGERRCCDGVHVRGLRVSTHAPLAGSDGSRSLGCSSNGSFNPRSPCGERRGAVRPLRGRCRVSTHAPLAGSDKRKVARIYDKLVSTHAPLAGSDCYILLM